MSAYGVGNRENKGRQGCLEFEYLTIVRKAEPTVAGGGGDEVRMVLQDLARVDRH